MNLAHEKFSILPRHIAIIMDGNGRWAKKRFLPRAAGHKAGYSQARDLVKFIGELGVEFLTLYVFSTENWRRPEEEVSFLMNMYIKSLKIEADGLHKNNVQVKIIGDCLTLPSALQEVINSIEKLTEKNSGLKLRLALNYGSKWELTSAAQKFAEHFLLHYQKTGEKLVLSEQDFQHYLQTSECPEVDLLIRTSGACRLSNYLLWQCAYAELYFTEILFPDFTPNKLKEALRWYAQQDRKFGTVATS